MKLWTSVPSVFGDATGSIGKVVNHSEDLWTFPPSATGGQKEVTVASIAAAPPKQSWLKRFGHIVGQILGFVAKEAKPVADDAAKVATILMPQFAPEIAIADNIVTNISLEAVKVEALAHAAGTTSGGGPQKLEAVLTNIGPSLDTWVASKFPGAKAVSAASKAGLVNAVVAILNEVDPAAAGVPPAPTS